MDITHSKASHTLSSIHEIGRRDALCVCCLDVYTLHNSRQSKPGRLCIGRLLHWVLQCGVIRIRTAFSENSCVQRGRAKRPTNNPTAPQLDISFRPFSRFVANQAIMLLGLRKYSRARSSRPSDQVVLDNPILYHMMSLDPNCPRFSALLAELLQSQKELKNLRKAEDERVLKLADFLYGVSVASHPCHLSHLCRS